MNLKRFAIMVTFVMVGITLIVLAFTMLETAPYLAGVPGMLLQLASFPSFVFGALAVSKGLPF